MKAVGFLILLLGGAALALWFLFMAAKVITAGIIRAMRKERETKHE